MDASSGGASDPGVTPEAPTNPPAPSRPDVPSPAADGQPEAQPGSGLQLEPCYRHPGQLTGVHCTRCGKPICVECMRPAAVGYQCPDDLAAEQRSGFQPQRGIRVASGLTP